MIDYYAEYYREPDTSRVLYENNQPIGIWPGIIGGVHQPPIFIARVSEKVQKKAITELLYREKDGLTQAIDFFTGELGISLWHRELLKMGARVEVKYDLFVDLSLPSCEIWRRMRRSYQKLINQYQNKYFAYSIQEATIERFGFYHAFHAQVAGKETRNPETWELQRKAINHKEAFSVDVKVRGPFEPVSGYALFNYSNTEAIYSVAVYDRELTEKKGIPLGHLTIWEAIKHCQSLGLKWLKLGDWAQDGNEKEQAIGHFKAGFATHILPRYEFRF